MEILLEPENNFALMRAYFQALPEELIPAQCIQGAHKLTGIEIQLGIAFFKLIKFFKHADGDDNVMLIKLIDAGTVMQDNICIKNKYFFALYSHIQAPGV